MRENWTRKQGVRYRREVHKNGKGKMGKLCIYGRRLGTRRDASYRWWRNDVEENVKRVY